MTLKRVVRVLMLIAIIAMMVVSLAGCGFVADGPLGWVYTDTTMPVSMGTAQNGTKAGRGCIHSFFGAISIGNASIETAMKDGGIKTVYTVNKENLSIFGTYTRQCTLVAGE
ncbi:TRL-like family protein [Candidatus Magnetominusculus xianensis]|uniref:TRL-like protein family n=1 Tax=Candidatus Magnetominusculus xianensis TaxID=1748249 RepID=A0ABR5SF51_9BACT|nr:TRL-like family protein [Candidatus Magnetominusculus xianensis]KWT76856.1 TRL-like protein family [Candidatus Magnetominusculus xianensis]MBF0402638.1 hypothetical protein [Nitrospirota bacterium]